MPRISVVIPNYNGAVYLETCLSALARQTCQDFELLIVDNASGDDSVETARRIAPDARILSQDRNLGFAGGANAGIRAAQGQWVAVLNNDTEVSERWLEECVAGIARHPDDAFFACRVLERRRRGMIYSAGDCFLRAGIGYRRGQELADSAAYDAETEVFSPSGCAALYRKSVLEHVGGYDERFFAYLEDVELGLRLQTLGLTGHYLPAARVFHHGAATSGGEFSPLAARLRTRNAILLLLKSLPGDILRRCLPMVITAQVFWLARAARHGRILSHLRGVGQALQLAPEMLRSRRELQKHWNGDAIERLWQSILRSESLARMDYHLSTAEKPSLFLKWYFRHGAP